MPATFHGVIGGVMAYGLVRLFIGAVILAVGYVLFPGMAGSAGRRREGLDPHWHTAGATTAKR